MAAIAPAACPVAMHVAWIRRALFAALSDEMIRPAARKFAEFFGISAPLGTVGTMPGLSGLTMSPHFGSWRSMG